MPRPQNLDHNPAAGRDPWLWLAAVMSTRGDLAEIERTYAKLSDLPKDSTELSNARLRNRYLRTFAKQMLRMETFDGAYHRDHEVEEIFNELRTLKSVSTGALVFPDLTVERVSLAVKCLGLYEREHGRSAVPTPLQGRVLRQRLIRVPFPSPRIDMEVLYIEYAPNHTELEALATNKVLFRQSHPQSRYAVHLMVEDKDLERVTLPRSDDLTEENAREEGLPLKTLLHFEEQGREWAAKEELTDYLQACAHHLTWVHIFEKDAPGKHFFALARTGTWLTVDSLTFSPVRPEEPVRMFLPLPEEVLATLPPPSSAT